MAASPTATVQIEQLADSHPIQELVDFLMHHGDTDKNWVPEEAILPELKGLATGDTEIWAAYLAGELVGFITAHRGGQFTVSVGREGEVAEIGEFVVHQERWGHGIGTKLADAARRGIFENHKDVRDLYVMVHEKNFGSAKAFRKAGYSDVLTFKDPARDRRTRVLRARRPLRVVGIQSGNAVDGIDVCVVEFQPPRLEELGAREVKQLSYRVLAFEVNAWEEEARERVLKLRDGVGGAQDYAEGNYEIGRCFADAVRHTLTKHEIELESVDLISSHGQSILGHPHWELGEPTVLAHELGVTTVADFRPADVAAGGNGSPCTASFDALMLRPPAGSPWRTCINIGGTTSVTFCPPQDSDEDPIGLDPGVGVFYMDLNAQLVDPSCEYDDGGQLARSGTVHEELLAEFLQHPHFQRTELPISIGAEDFPRPLFQEWLERSQALGLTPADFQATLTELTARSLALACKRFGRPTTDVIVRGSVRKNLYFMERLQANLCEQTGVEITRLGSLSDLGIDEQAWETAMYAMFGYLCFQGLHNFVPSCTGADEPVVGGKICPGKNFAAVTLR